MPAAARNYSHPSVEDEIATPLPNARGARTRKSPRPAARRVANDRPTSDRPTSDRPGSVRQSRDRKQRSATRPRAAVAAAVAAPVAPSTVPEWQRIRPHVEHFTSTETVPELEAAPLPLDERAIRRLAKKRHRPFTMSLFSIVISAWMFFMVVTLLWWSSRAASALQRSMSLEKDIELVRREITNAQREISALDSSPHLARWAQQRNWAQASSTRIDDVTKAIPPRLEAPPTAGDASADAPSPPSSTRVGGERQ